MAMSAFPNMPSSRPTWYEFRSSEGFITVVVALAAFTIVPVTPTALERRVGTDPQDVQRLVSLLLALEAFAWLVTSPITGHVADRIKSRRTPLLAGLPALVISTALLYVGDSLLLWVIGRILMGVSAAVTWTVGLALLVDTTDRERLGETLGYMSMGMMVGTTAGPLLGGVIYKAGGYHSVFGAAFALIFVDAVLRLAMLEKKQIRSADGGEEAVTEPLLPATESGNVSDRPNYGIAGEASVEPCDDAADEKWSSPIFVLLSMPRIRICLWAYCVISMSLTAFDSALPLFVRDTFSWSQLGQGLIFLPLSATQVFDPVTGIICDKYPNKRGYIAAVAFVAAGASFCTLRIVTHDSLAQKIVLCVLLGLLGLSVSFAVPPILVSIQETLDDKAKDDVGAFGSGGAVALAYGLVNSAFAVGALLGPLMGGYLRSVAGWGTMTLVLALANGATGAVMLRMRR
ncbi:putative MFS-type transporter C18.02 [Beauveria bassiana]|nr:putative MFS-type transporter C18.02 [Beauveria bassiana]KAH8719606.1 putative MFS-type transporter C18.02 [Beauveria bassiana]